MAESESDLFRPGIQGFGNHVRDMHDADNTEVLSDAEFDSVKQAEYYANVEDVDADGVQIDFSSFNPLFEDIINKDQTEPQGPSPN